MAGDDYDRVGDLVTLVRGTTYKGALVGKPGPALLGLGSIVPGGGFRAGDFKTYGGECPDQLMLSPGDLYVSLKGATKDGEMIGSVAQVPSQVASGRLTQDTVKLAIAPEFEDLRQYLYWLLRGPQYRAYCAGHATGSAVVGLSRNDFLSYPVPRFTAFRASVVTLLDSLDEKTELNRRMNETLEAMAQAIFRDWFVDFGPTRRKLEGASDPITIMGGLVQDPERAQALADLFPATLGDPGLPLGWSFKPLEESLVLQRGFDLPKFSRTDGLYPVIAASGPSGTHSEFKVVAPGVCTGRSGVLGNVFYVQQDFWPLNTSLWIKAYPNATPIYAYFLLREIDLLGLNAGSAVPTLNRNHVHNRPTVTPPMAVVSAYTGLAEMLMVKSDQAAKECQTLARTRDLLLPQLMSGEIRLSEAEGLTEAAQ